MVRRSRWSREWVRAGGVLLGLFGTGACSETGGGNGGSTVDSSVAASPAEIRTFCEAQCDRATRCSQTGTDPATCADGCITDLGALADNVRADVVAELTRCFDTLECGTTDDICLDRAYQATIGDVDAAIHSPEVQSCIDKQAECSGTSGAFSDDLCGTFLLLVDSQRRAAFQCIDRPCPEIPSCLAPIVGE